MAEGRAARFFARTRLGAFRGFAEEVLRAAGSDSARRLGKRSFTDGGFNGREFGVG